MVYFIMLWYWSCYIEFNVGSYIFILCFFKLKIMSRMICFEFRKEKELNVIYILYFYIFIFLEVNGYFYILF